MGSVIDPTARQDILKRCQASQGMLLCVNAERKGNVGRFVNCSRNHYNCVVKPVVTKKHHSTLFYK